EPSGRVGFGLEPTASGGLFGEIGAQDLDGHRPTEPPVGGIPHGAHPAVAEQRPELVAPGEQGRCARTIVVHRGHYPRTRAPQTSGESITLGGTCRSEMLVR